MSPQPRNGFTVVEVVIAIVILSLGILGLVSTAATVTRMVGQSQRYTTAASLAEQRFEILKSTSCANMSSGSATQGRYTIAWTVAASGSGKAVTVTVTSPTTRGNRTDTFTSVIGCVS